MYSIKYQKVMDQATDLILSIPVNKARGQLSMNLFMHYLNHEDWFEVGSILLEEEINYNTGQKMKMYSKDIESSKM